jgi:hypothetical protein
MPDSKLRSEDRLYEVRYKEALSIYNREKQTYETQKTRVVPRVRAQARTETVTFSRNTQ